MRSLGYLSKIICIHSDLALHMAYFIFLATVAVLWLVGVCVYNVFLHPLKAIPGPFMAKISRFWIFGLEMRGNPHVEILDLHRKYGIQITTD